MRIAFTHNLKLTQDASEAEFDTPATVDAVTRALQSLGHVVEKVEVGGPASHLVARLEAFSPDIVFNTAEGRAGRAREAFYPALFEQLRIPYTGSDAYTCTLTLDKNLSKLVVAQAGVDVAQGRVLKQLEDLPQGPLFFPCLVKPNHEGSSKFISDENVAGDRSDLKKIVERALKECPDGVLVEQFIPGRDITVDFLEGPHGVLEPVDYAVDASYKRKYNLYDFRLKNELAHLVQVRCPALIPRDVAARVQAVARVVFKALGIRDTARADFRLGDDGRVYFLECNALPSLAPGNSLYQAGKRVGLDETQVVGSILRSAAARAGLLKEAPAEPVKKKAALRVGFAYNIKRIKPTQDGSAGDEEAEFDSEGTLDAIAKAIASHGHEVVRLEANPDLPRALMANPVDVVFNIAEGFGGRAREAHVPAMLELLAIPYTGSDAATLAVALDKALAKRVLKQHDIPTPAFMVMNTGKERLDKSLRFPLIVKPNAEGTSKGIGPTSVVDNEAELRERARELIERYNGRALVEEYISGREFTIGLLGDPHPKVLPPMEIVFTDPNVKRPLYDFAIKQDWNKHVQYICPAQVTPQIQRKLERVAEDTFEALDCRDVARVDVRLSEDGIPYVLEVNPLPGLTPGFSDLVLIARAAGVDYHGLIGEILAGAIRRLKLQKAGFKTGKSKPPKAPVTAPAPAGTAGGGAVAGQNGSASTPPMPAPAEGKPPVIP
ncbi:MAG: ATP-grasp domain-containing protein [Deltaproteobacteria bacterium]|nr:ATP-grasp domain-containing protein [Deltaproteobacteria bacterium]